MGKGRWASGEIFPRGPSASDLPPASHPHLDAPRERVAGGRQMSTEREAGRGLTSGQGWTPQGQEKQQPSADHGPFGRRQATAADLRCGRGELAPTRLPSRPQAQLHLSCSTAEPFPSRGAPPTLPGPPNPILSHGPGNSGCTPTQELGAHTPTHLKSPSASLALPSMGHRARGSMSRA